MSDSSADLLLKIDGLHKRFGDNVVLAGASLSVPRGRLVAVLGRSGSGKSVLLKCLAGVIQPDQGVITFDGQQLKPDGAAARADFRRRCSFLFQSNIQLALQHILCSNATFLVPTLHYFADVHY